MYQVVRLINQLVKRRVGRLHPSALACLLALKIRDIDMDAESDVKRKIKQDEKHKKRIVNLSKKEKKVSNKNITLDDRESNLHHGYLGLTGHFRIAKI